VFRLLRDNAQTMPAGMTHRGALNNRNGDRMTTAGATKAAATMGATQVTTTCATKVAVKTGATMAATVVSEMMMSVEGIKQAVGRARRPSPPYIFYLIFYSSMIAPVNYINYAC
jgi:hypothetical protein